MWLIYLFCLLLWWRGYFSLSQPPLLGRNFSKWKITLNQEKCPSPLLLKRALIVLLFGGGINLISLSVNAINSDDWRLETLDVGQGLATLVVKDQHGILYDTGAAWRTGSMAELEILPYLRRKGIVLDKLILSHDDNDHSGGADAILQSYPDVELITSSKENAGKKHRTYCIAGNQWLWQGLHIQVISPKTLQQRANNEDSCVLMIDDGQHHILLTGDADIKTEFKFIDMLDEVEVLQVGHHGSKTSTSKLLVEKLRPQIALISSGRWNPWGFPHSIVLERLNSQHSDIYNTAEVGQITLSFTPKATARWDFSPWYQGLIGLPAKSR